MERLVEECELACPEEKQIQVLEKCLALVRADRDTHSKSLGWLLLSKILEKCSPQCLRAAQSRLGKKLADVKSEPNIHNGIFVRQLLIRNPQVGNLHAELVYDIIMRFVDIAVTSSDSTLRSLCTELYSVRYGCDTEMSTRLLTTLSAAMSNRLLSQEERAALLNLKSFGITSLRSELCRLLFDLYSSALGRAKSGQYVPRDLVMCVLEEALNDPQLCDAALTTIQSICKNCRSSMLPLIPRMVLMLISKLDTPSSSLYDTLAHICRLYGPGSTLFRHLYEIFSAMKHPLDEQIYGLSAGRLLSAVIETSAFLVKPEVLLTIERKICEEILCKPESLVYREILTSFLSCSHELVPPPVQIARTVMARCADAADMQSLKHLCEVITRPRIQNLAHHEVIRRRLAKLSTDEINNGVANDVNFARAHATSLGDFVEFDKRVAAALQEEEQKKKKTDGFPVFEKESFTQSHTTVDTVTNNVQQHQDSPEIMELPAKEENADSRSLVSKPKRKQFTTTNIDPSPQPLAKRVKLKKKNRAKKQSEQHQDSPEIMELPVKDENADSRSLVSKPKRKQFTTTNIDPSPQPLAKKVKLKKKIKAKKQSEKVTLMEGEATVEEILSTFCPE